MALAPIALPSSFLREIDVWTSGQTMLPKVLRWKKYLDQPPSGVRPQNTLQHSYSLALLMSLALGRLRTYHPQLDEPLLLLAALIHDHGEGELGSDTHYIDKSATGDQAELRMFEMRFMRLSRSDFARCLQAFLLQFAARDTFGEFPTNTQAILRMLSQKRMPEALIFEGIERYDYVLYAAEQYQRRGNTIVMVQVLRNQVARLDRIAELVPGFGLVVWSPEIRTWASAVLERHGPEVPSEQTAPPNV